ncbi:3002_t:CDS:1 [Acaulospora colombiana]|uniref:3002_t:CDS:1 n=1 Tax=Acaulospora colombiana TaxID=27376 RepID=A0ACA9KI61_9GLOM|nr:3002_t:CDS:1 [Acaulospora colombiana]
MTLKNCLPHIRYFQLSNEDIWKNVRPYRKILNKQLWDDIIQRSMIPEDPVILSILPKRLIIIPEIPKRIESNIINCEHVSEISTWIDRNNVSYSIRNTPYEFQLILRGSRDGFNPKTFWDMCHGHEKTVLILKVAGTDEIIGGYNPMKWDKTYEEEDEWIKTSDSFIFSLKNDSIKESILSRIKNPYRAVINSHLEDQETFGPIFGCDEICMMTRMSDFTKGESYCDESSIYEKNIRKTTNKFSIVDYEVFKIVKLEEINNS